ncbi:uncharacterized protein [Montipora capricornis]|uniref:uncharacterized protein isoform X3 n=1 Tax=Montipora capricornis TaxID=246305 RepID=UPI0035F1D1F7
MAYHRCMLTFLGVILLFVLSVTSQGVCPRGWQLINGSWYEVSSTSANWTAAKSACEAMGSTLAMLKTHAEQQAVWRKVGKRVWIGLHRNPNDRSQWLWIDGSQVTDTNWYTGEPNNAGGYEGCGEMYSSSRRGTWNDQPCNDTLLYLCEAKGTCERLSLGSGVHVSPSHCLSSNQSYGSTCSFSCARGYRLSGPLSTQCMELGVWSEDVRTVSCKGVCPRGWQLINGSCYEVSSTSANWTAAKLACEAMGSRLAMLKTHAEQQAVWRAVGKNVWIGLHRNPNDSSQWLWIDGSQVTDTNWYTGEPNNAGGYEGCGEMYSFSRRGTWNDQPCSDTLLYLCEAKGTCERLSLGSGVHVSPSHCLSSNQSYGLTCSFSCARGYRLSGPLSTQCMELGVWSEDVRTVSCKGTCERLSLGSGVHVSPSHCLSSNQSYGSTCSFSCARGYRLSGPLSTQCMELGVWSEDVRTVSCKGTCERLSLGSGVHVSPSHCLSSNQSYGSTCSFSCARGYRLSGPLSTQCMELGVWSEDVRTVSCKEFQCPCDSTLLVIIGVLVAIIIVLILVIAWQHRKLGIARKKRPYKVAEDKDKAIHDNEVAMEELNPTNDPPSSSNQELRRLIEPASMSLQGTTHYEVEPSNPNSSPQNVEYAPLDIRTRSWEVTREDMKVEKVIGKGAFGQVAKGTAKNLPFHSGTKTVAVKMLKANAPESDKRDLKSELDLMKTLKPHPHVIKLLGCVTETDPLLVLIEYVPYGDLLGYLRKSRGLNDTYYKDPDIKPQTSLTSQQLMKFAWQIADGMNYLSLRKIIHRDLAARNVLVGETETCKVTDFGMARDVQQESIYERKTRVTKLEHKKVQETRRDYRVFFLSRNHKTIKYNPFCFLSSTARVGCQLNGQHMNPCCMENTPQRVTCGSPYPRMDGKKIASLLQQGYRMPKPEHVDNDLYQIMMNCWQNEPEARPSFADLTQQLKGMETQHKRLLNMHIYNNELYADLEDLNA